MIPYHEIVRVLDGKTLINSESYQCRYDSQQFAELQVGVYIITWPQSVCQGEYDSNAQFIGPFATRAEAVTILQRALRAHYFADSDALVH